MFIEGRLLMDVFNECIDKRKLQFKTYLQVESMTIFKFVEN